MKSFEKPCVGQVLQRLDEAQLGSLLVLRPGEVALISCMGSHGVWVPSPELNTLPKEVSVIRAAEVFLWPGSGSVPLMFS